jgi:hypothetical protein
MEYVLKDGSNFVVDLLDLAPRLSCNKVLIRERYGVETSGVLVGINIIRGIWIAKDLDCTMYWTAKRMRC